MQIENIILKPVVTEKSAVLENNGKYIFKVLAGTNKIEIRKAIEKIFGTKVADVNIVNTRSKTKRRGKTTGTVSGYKKAIVTLKKGEKIKIREDKKQETKKLKKEEIKKSDKIEEEKE
jgi:large subunit ribosomal protein L23